MPCAESALIQIKFKLLQVIQVYEDKNCIRFVDLKQNLIWNHPFDAGHNQGCSFCDQQTKALFCSTAMKLISSPPKKSNDKHEYDYIRIVVHSTGGPCLEVINRYCSLSYFKTFDFIRFEAIKSIISNWHFLIILIAWVYFISGPHLL